MTATRCHLGRIQRDRMDLAMAKNKNEKKKKSEKKITR